MCGATLCVRVVVCVLCVCVVCVEVFVCVRMSMTMSVTNELRLSLNGFLCVTLSHCKHTTFVTFYSVYAETNLTQYPNYLLPYTSIQSDLFTTPPLVVLPYTSIQSDLFTTPPLVVLPYTSIQSDLFTTPPLVVLPYTSIQSDLFTTPPLVGSHTLVYSQTSSQHHPW